jgi:hypothetical protein
MEFDMPRGAFFVATVAMMFAAGGLLSTVASAEQGVKCSGVNSCKGTSACKTALSACKGQNSCKGMGWTETKTASDCQAKGGKVL